MSENKPDIARQVETVASVVSPLALATAMLYYFGWVRTTVQARALGYDASLSGLSTQDYVLKSINILFPALVVLMLIAVGLAVTHRAAMALAQRSTWFTKAMGRIGVLAGLAWIALVPLGFAATLVGPRTAEKGYALPLAIAVGMTGVLYADVVRKRLSRPDEAGLGRSSRFLIVTLLVLALFWSTERYARSMGEDFAADIIANPSQLTSVTVFSPERLAITDSCVKETVLGEGADAYRYDGLRLLQVTGGRNYLIAICRKTSRVLIIDPDDDVRLEFVPGASNTVATTRYGVMNPSSQRTTSAATAGSRVK